MNGMEWTGMVWSEFKRSYGFENWKQYIYGLVRPGARWVDGPSRTCYLSSWMAPILISDKMDVNGDVPK